MQELEAPPLGIVLLLSAPRPAQVESLAAGFSRATGRAVTPVIPDNPRAVQQGQLPPGDVVVAVPPTCLVHIDGTMFLVHSVSEPYFADADEVAAQLDDLRERMAVEQHRAWISVELLHEEAASAENYRIVAQVTADLLGDDCLAMFHPESGSLVVPGPETVNDLRCERPLETVFGCDPHVPVLCVDDDPRLQAAAEEARQRFPEFARAFADGTGDNFAVKARFDTGGQRSEHIWIDVEAIEGNIVRGLLGNAPVNLAGLTAGSPVHVETSAIEDWAYLRNGEPNGLFSVPVLMAMQAERAGVASNLIH